MRVAHVTSPASLPISTLMDAASNAGFSEVDAVTVKAQVSYLVDKGWLKEVENTFSPGQKRWKVTAEGTDELERQGLV